MSQYELAQLNIAVMKDPLDSSRMADFVANLERINAMHFPSATNARRPDSHGGSGFSLTAEVSRNVLMEPSRR
jgi:hypothetical protein